MGFLSRFKKSHTAAKATAAGGSSTRAATAKGGVARKEPLLDGVPADEPPGWTDVDGAKRRSDVDDPEAGDYDDSLPPYYRERQQAKELWAKVVAGVLWLLGCGGGAITTVKLALWAAGTVALIATIMLATPAPMIRDAKVAFIGNSYFFVNDLPRLMEAVTGGHISQDSCLHGSGSLLNILKTGNGMYYKWQSENAMKGGTEWVNSNNAKTYLYDYGACSVPQLLTGKDDLLSYQNQYGHYASDGTNPCLVDNNYLDWENSRKSTPHWDFVIMVDQSKRMAFDDAREEALMAFNYTYGPLLRRKSAVPILVQPHAFWSEQVNMTGLTDVPTFTSLIKEGALVYQNFLNQKLGRRKTRIAPVGNAFLTVYEEDRTLWSKLFLDDGIHPSTYGTYLYSMVIHASMYKAMPPKRRVVNKKVDLLFAKARKVHSSDYPTKDEARTLWKIARKVAIYGHKPKSMKKLNVDYVDENDAALEETEDDEFYADQGEADDDAMN
jgi:hypothetical protein